MVRIVAPLERSSAFASLLYGRVFFMRPYSAFFGRMKRSMNEGLIVICYLLGWLIIAAALEAFISPWEFYSFQEKFILGIVVSLIFWIWTFSDTQKISLWARKLRSK